MLLESIALDLNHSTVDDFADSSFNFLRARVDEMRPKVIAFLSETVSSLWPHWEPINSDDLLTLEEALLAHFDTDC